MNGAVRSVPECRNAMTEGFIVDKTYGGAAAASWVEGEPKKSIWVGVKLGGTTRIEVTTWRCRGCGFLESNAPPE